MLVNYKNDSKVKMKKRSFIIKITKLLKNSFILNILLKNIIYFYLRILFLTYKLEVKYEENILTPINKNEGVFYFWHQNIIAAMFFFFKSKAIGHCIVSPSKDGLIAAFIAKKLGFKVIYGSAYKTSIKVIRQALDVLDVNKRLSIVGDGSRGPVFNLQRGVMYLAAKSQVPLIFIECKTKKAITFEKSWDKFKIPLPFSKISITVHSPVTLSKDAYKKHKEEILVEEK